MSQCGHANCTKRPTYGVAGSKKREFCSQHAREGMINVNNKRCIETNCATIPSFAVAGSKKAEFCSQHAREGMIDVRSKRCSQRGCNTQPSLGNPGGGSKIPGSCSEHASKGMVGLRSKRCSRRGCTLRPSYIPGRGNKKAEFCAKHANDGNLTAGVLSRFGEYGGGGRSGAAAAAGAGAGAGARTKRKKSSTVSPYELAMAGISSEAAAGGGASTSSSDPANNSSNNNNKRPALPLPATTSPTAAPSMSFPPQPGDRYIGGESMEFRPLLAASSDRYLGAESLAHFRSPSSDRYFGGFSSHQFQPQPTSSIDSSSRYHLSGGVGSQFRTPSNPNDRYGAGGEGAAYSEEIAASMFDKELPL